MKSAVTAPRVIDLIKKRDAYKMAAGSGAAGATIGAIAGYAKGRTDKKGHKKKASDNNKYLEKIAKSIGDIGKALIRTKLAPGISRMSKAVAGQVENISRAYTGSKVAPRIYSTKEYAAHASAMGNLGKKLIPGGGMPADQTSRVMAVAARARRMGVIPGT